MTEYCANSIGENHQILGLAEPLPLSALMELKKQQAIRIEVILPAMNEGRTIGHILDTWSPLHSGGLLDGIMVIDSGSTDDTKEEVERRGYPHIIAQDQLTSFGLSSVVRGKGVNMWLAQFLTQADILVFADSDMQNPKLDTIQRLVSPVFADPGIKMVKSIFTRDTTAPAGDVMAGGRVTKLTALPLLQVLFPELTGIVQPLNGNIAIRKDVMATIPMACRYEADLQILLETAMQHGPDSIAQIFCGSFKQDGQNLDGLEIMANQYVRTLFYIAQKAGRISLSSPLPPYFVQYTQNPQGRVDSISHEADQLDLLPPASTIIR